MLEKLLPFLVLPMNQSNTSDSLALPCQPWHPNVIIALEESARVKLQTQIHTYKKAYIKNETDILALTGSHFSFSFFLCLSLSLSFSRARLVHFTAHFRAHNIRKYLDLFSWFHNYAHSMEAAQRHKDKKAIQHAHFPLRVHWIRV